MCHVIFNLEQNYFNRRPTQISGMWLVISTNLGWSLRIKAQWLLFIYTHACHQGSTVVLWQNYRSLTPNSSFTNFAFMQNPYDCVYTLIAMEIYHYIIMRDWKSATRIISDMDAIVSCIFNLCDVCMCMDITFFCAQGLPQGSSLKKKSVSGGSFTREKLVKEELKRWNSFSKNNLKP